MLNGNIGHEPNTENSILSWLYLLRCLRRMFFSRMKMYPHVRNGDVGNEPNPERFNLLTKAHRWFDTDGLNNLE